MNRSPKSLTRLQSGAAKRLHTLTRHASLLSSHLHSVQNLVIGIEV